MPRAYSVLLFAVVLVGLAIGWVINNPGQDSFGRASAAAIGDDDPRPILQARYDAMQAASVAHDTGTFGSMLAPDFTCIDPFGRSETGPEVIAQTTALKLFPNRSATMLPAISVQGDTAVVQERYEAYLSRKAGRGKPHNIEIVALSTDTWIKSGNTWLIERSVTDEISAYDNGRLISHQ